MAMFWRSACAAASALLLTGCLVTPGKFESALDIRADRSFTFSYKGEIIASDMGKDGILGDMPDPSSGDGDAQQRDSAFDKAQLFQIQDVSPPEKFGDTTSKDDSTEMQAIAAALVKEKGFRSATYLGNHKFAVDYLIAGKLDHAFLFPFNSDAQITCRSSRSSCAVMNVYA